MPPAPPGTKAGRGPNPPDQLPQAPSWIQAPPPRGPASNSRGFQARRLKSPSPIRPPDEEGRKPRCPATQGAAGSPPTRRAGRGALDVLTWGGGLTSEPARLGSRCQPELRAGWRGPPAADRGWRIGTPHGPPLPGRSGVSSAGPGWGAPSQRRPAPHPPDLGRRQQACKAPSPPTQGPLPRRRARWETPPVAASALGGASLPQRCGEQLLLLAERSARPSAARIGREGGGWLSDSAGGAASRTRGAPGAEGGVRARGREGRDATRRSPTPAAHAVLVAAPSSCPALQRSLEGREQTSPSRLPAAGCGAHAWARLRLGG